MAISEKDASMQKIKGDELTFQVGAATHFRATRSRKDSHHLAWMPYMSYTQSPITVFQQGREGEKKSCFSEGTFQ